MSKVNVGGSSGNAAINEIISQDRNPSSLPAAPGSSTPTTYSDPVKAFQAAHGLVVDGIVGPKTLAAGYQAPGSPASSASKGSGSGVPVGAGADGHGPVYDAIKQAAAENGVPLNLALAMAQQESGFNPNVFGDHGTSVGLYQLHRGGELGNLSFDAARDPYTNASIALRQVGAVLRQHPEYNMGQVAAAAQRPADAAGYANGINSILGSATADPSYFQTQLSNAGGLRTGEVVSSSGAGANATPGDNANLGAYSYIGDLAKSEPDLAALLTKYASQDLTVPAVAARAEADIQNTGWWRNHDKAYRDAEILKATSPAQFTDNVQQNVQKVQQGALSYFVHMSPQTAQSWATKLASGQITADDYQRYLQEQAKSMFPGLSGAIDRGVTVEQYTDPYKQMAATTLEKDPNSINLMNDPKYMKALFSVDPKTGDRTPMSLADWQSSLRAMPEYATTRAANQSAAELGDSIAQTFGKVA